MKFPYPLVMIPLSRCGGYELLSFKNERTDLECTVMSLYHFPVVICDHMS